MNMASVAMGLLFAMCLAVLSACGGGDGGELSLEEYFQQVETIVDDFGGQIAALGDPFEADVDSDEERTELIRDYTRAAAALWRDSVEDFRDMEPPAEVAAAHDEAVEARDDRAEFAQDLAEQLEGVGSAAELEAWFTEARREHEDALASAAERSEQACLELQRIADDSGIDVELQCLTFTQEGSSMLPTVPDGARLTVREYGNEVPARGELVVFKSPRDPNRHFMKRVIGLPGDRLEIIEGVAYANGEPLDEPYIRGLTTCPCGPWHIEEGRYFVLGDNRPNSSDSRVMGQIPEENIIGRVADVGPLGGRATW